jgi:hypothetical protein
MPATRHVFAKHAFNDHVFGSEKPLRQPSLIKEQRYLPPPDDAPFIEQTYDINSVLKAANYLVRVEDRMLPAAFFAEPRYGFRTIIGLLTKVRQWKNQGYTRVRMVHKPDAKVSVHQPFGRYYVWEWRLKTLKDIEPINKKDRRPGNLAGVDYWFGSK